ncbi:MAG: CoA-binding protein [Candidatus Micrarchaeota archaeon]
MAIELDEVLAPKSIAVIGASRDPASVGQGVLKSLVLGCFMESGFCKPFQGKIFPVNPKADEILGLKCYPSVKDVPEPVDLALVCVPAPIVPAIARECAEKKVKGIVVISAGFAELGPEGKARQDELLKICRDAEIQLIGPNCVSGDTPLLICNDDHVKYASIKQFAEPLLEKHSKKVILQSDTLVLGLDETMPSFKIASFDGTKATWSRVTKIMKRTGVEDAVKIIVEGGNELTCSRDHPLFVEEKGVIVRKAASQCRAGDKTVLIHAIAPEGEETTQINLIEEINEKVPPELKKIIRVRHDGKSYDFDKFIARQLSINELRSAQLSTRNARVRIPAVLDVTDELCALAGFFVADGDYKKDCLRIGYTKDANTTSVLRAYTNLSKLSNLCETSKRNELKFGRTIGRIVFEHVFGIGTNSMEKSVPNFIFSAPQSKICSFLNGLYSGDGCMYLGKKRATLYLGSTSKRLIDQVRFLMDLLDVGPFYASRKRRNFVVCKGKKWAANDLYELRTDAKQTIKKLYKKGFRFLVKRKNDVLEKVAAAYSTRRRKTNFSFARIKAIEEIGAPVNLYDFEVEKTHSFIAGQIVTSNCLGFLRPPVAVNASFALSSPPAGGVAFITQSGAIADSVIDWAIKERYAFSAIISVGNAAELGVAEFVEWAARDAATKVITVYVEGIADGRRLMHAVREAVKTKPVVVLKAGRTAAGLEAVTSHTGAMAGSFQVFAAAMKQAGAVLADSIEEMFDLAKAFAEQPRLKQNAVAVITNGGGAGVLCADYCAQYGVNLVPLKPETIAKLDATGKMHPAYSRRNPLDLVGDALADRYKAAVEILLDEPYIHGLMVVQTLQTMTQSVADATLLIEAQKKHPEKPIVSVFMGGKFSAEAITLLESNNVPDFNDPKKAAKAMAALGGLL